MTLAECNRQSQIHGELINWSDHGVKALMLAGTIVNFWFVINAKNLNLMFLEVYLRCGELTKSVVKNEFIIKEFNKG